MQVAVFVVGKVLYYLVNRRCCEFRSKDLQVFLALGSTAGLNAFLFLALHFTYGNSNVGFLKHSIGTLIQMFIQLIVFSTAMKVKTACH